MTFTGNDGSLPDSILPADGIRNVFPTYRANAIDLTCSYAKI
jgi:hypothetical protein